MVISGRRREERRAKDVVKGEYRMIYNLVNIIKVERVNVNGQPDRCRYHSIT